YDINYPGNADSWGPERVLRAEVIVWLCTDKKAKELVTHKGIQIWGARVDNELDLLDASIPFSLTLLRCRLARRTRFIYAHVSALILEASHIVTLEGDGLHVDNDVFLRKGFNAKGFVRLLGARIEGDLDCRGGRFLNDCTNGLASLDVYGAKITGDFRLDGFKAEGLVSLNGAEIGGKLDCSGAKFLYADESVALNAVGVKIKGSVYFHNQAEIHATANFMGAQVDGYFLWHDLIRHDRTGLWLQSAHVGTLWDDKESWPGAGKLKLDGFTYDRIHEDAPLSASERLKWLQLDQPVAGDEIESPTSKGDGAPNPRNATQNRTTAHRAVAPEKRKFNPQPYEQLASVLKKQGHVEDAKDILVGKEQDRAAHELRIVGNEEWKDKTWKRFRGGVHWILGVTVDYGYRPMKALRWALGVSVLGWMLFKLGQILGVMTPVNEKAYVQTKETDWSRVRRRFLLGKRRDVETPTKSPREISPDYPKFRAWVYSIDEFAPLVNLRQGDYWIPNLNRDVWAIKGWRGRFVRTYGRFLRFYLTCHIASGWILSTLLLAGLTGLVQR
ncbi:MAG: hypothetical protein AABZ47_11375, partial [Planctomycetota bacterium]